MEYKDTWLSFDEYQLAAHETAQYEEVFYPFASLMVEASELSDLVIKPLLRGDKKLINPNDIIAEAGDVLWNLAEICTLYGVTLQEVADYNIAKLRSRAERGVIKGDGGDR